MQREKTATGARAFLASLGPASERSEQKLIRLIVAYTGWLLLLFVAVVWVLSPELKARWPWILGWLGLILLYLFVLEFLSRTQRAFYETVLFRLVRIEIVALLGSILVWITGGVSSQFWPVYLWPLLASTLYFAWSATWAIYAEVAVLYIFACVVQAGGFHLDYSALLVNLAVLFVITMVLRYLMESLRRYYEAEKALEYSRLLQETQRDVDTAIDLQEVLDRIIQKAVELAGTRNGSLMLMEGGALHFRARCGDSVPEGKMERTFEPGEGIAGWVAKSGEPYVCHDTRADDRFVPVVSGIRILSLVSAPIISHGTVLGVINVDSTEPHRFSDADARRLLTLASATAVAIERAQLLDSLLDASRKSSGVARDLYDSIVRSVHRLTHCPVALWLVDDRDRTKVNLSASEGLRPEYSRGRMLDLHHSATGLALESAAQWEIEDIETDPLVAEATKAEARVQGWKSMLIVPLPAGTGKAVGTLSIYSHEARRFAKWDRDLLATFAAEAGSAVQNSERLRAIQELSDVGRSLATLQESPDVLQQTLERIAKAALEVLRADLVDLYEYHAAENAFTVPPIMAGERWHRHLVVRKIRHDDVVHRVVRDGKAIFASDARTHPVLAGGWEGPREGGLEQRFVVREGIVSASAFPIPGKGEILGVLFASYRHRRDFAEPELQERIEAFAGFAGAAIQNARLLQREQVLYRQAETLRLVGTGVTSVQGLKEAASSVLDQLREAIGYRRASIQLLHGDRRKLVAYRGFSPEELDESLLRPVSEDPLVSRMVKDRMPVVLPDLGQPQKPEGWEVRAETQGIMSWVGLPLVFGDEVVGLLTLDHGLPGYYRQHSDSLLRALAAQVATVVSNAHSVDELRLLQDVGAKITSTLDLEEVMERLVMGALELTDTISGVIHVVNAAGTAIEKSYGFPREYEHSEPRLSEQGYTRYIIEQAKQVVLPDTHVDTRANPEIVEKGVRAFVGTPLMLRGGRVVGVLYLNDTGIRSFSERELSMLRTLADQAAIAIDNAWLFSQLRVQREAEIVAIGEISKSLAATEKRDEALNAILDSTLTLLGQASLGEIRLLDTKTMELWVTASRGDTIADGYSRIPLGLGITGWVAEHKQSQLVEDVTKDKRYLPFLEGTRSELAVPMLMGDRLIGVLNIEHPQVDALTETDLRLAEAMAGLSVVAIHIHDTLQRRIGELETLSEIGRMLSTQEIDRILDSIYAGMTKVLKLTDAQVQIAFYDEASNEVSFPLAIEQKDGKQIDVVRWGKRETAYRKEGEGEEVQEFQPRVRREPPGLTEYVIRSQRAVRIVERFEHTAREMGTRVFAEFGRLKRPTHSWLGVPMKVTPDRVTGVISIQSLERERAFDEGDVKLLASLADQAAVAIENARYLQRLHEFALQIASKLDRDTLIREAAWQANAVAGADFTTIFLYDEVRHEFYAGFRASRVLPQPTLPGMDGLSASIVRTGKEVILNDCSEEPRLKKGFVQAKHLVSTAGFPITYAGAVKGVVFVNYQRRHLFTEPELNILRIISSSVGVAVENAGLYQDLAQYSKQLEELLDAGLQVSSRLELDSVLLSIAGQVCRVLGADTAEIYPYQAARKEFGKGVRAGTSSEALDRPSESGPAARLLKENSPVFRTQQDLTEHERIAVSGRPVLSYAGIPLHLEGQPVGVLLVYYHENHAFSGNEARMAQLFGLQAAAAINNARQYEVSQKLARIERWAELGQLAASLAHRIGNTGGTIRLRTNLLGEYLGDKLPHDPVVGKEIETISRNNQYLLDLSTVLLKPFRAFEERTALSNVELQVSGALHSARIPEHIKVVTSYSAQLPLVRANRFFVEVFLEIITNAVAAMRSSPTKVLRISTDYDDNWVRVSFSDTGKGIPEKDQARIFELFGSPGTDKERTHVGFGLWWIRTFLRDLGGDIEVKSQPNMGATFTIRLPREEQG
jgi:GAF domain-containing protein